MDENKEEEKKKIAAIIWQRLTMCHLPMEM